MRKKHYNKRPKEYGLFVYVENNNVEKAISRFKQKIKDSELMLEIKRRSFYEKPSEKKRHIKNLAKLRAKYKKIKED
jgi:small subunit ribosomal protein S21